MNKVYSSLEIDDIISLYITAKDKDEEVFILAELTASDADTIIEVLKDLNVYEEKHIQPCFNCGELYIEKNRKRICPTCILKNKKNNTVERLLKRRELR